MNSKYLIFSIWFYLFSFKALAQIGIGTLSPNESSKLDLKSGTRGFLLTRMTLQQRNAISNPTAGLQIYCTDCGNNGLFQMYNGTTWVNSVGTATNIAVPSSPSNPVATALGYIQASVSFTPSTNNGGSQITNYIVTSSPGNVSASGSTSPIVVDGLSDGVSYTFNVIAANLAGNSTASAASNLISMPAINGNAICDGSAYFDFNDITSTTGRVWMDRNLGASRAAISATDYYAYGCLYQWGRANDGHASINWSAANSGTAVNGTSASLSSSSTATNSLFINNTNTPYDWLNTQDNNLWQYSTNTNNPCPSGYFVPTAAELAAEFSSYSITNNSTAFTNGPSGGFKFVSAGSRNGTNGNIINASSSGNYWTQSINNSNASSYNIGSSSATMEIINRNSGLSIRCVKGASNGNFILSAHPQDGSVLLQFNTFASATDYIIYYKLNSNATFSVFTDGINTNSFATVTGLTNGNLYDFKVQVITTNNGPVFSNLISISPSTNVLNNSYHQILTTGQSNSLGNGTPITTTQIYDNKMLNASLNALIPLVEPCTGDSEESKSTAMATFISNQSIFSNGHDYKTIVTLAGVNGASYICLKKNSICTPSNYNQTLDKMLAAKNISSSLGLPYVISAFTVVHGETDYAAAASVYKGYLEEWQNDLETGSKLITGQTGTIPMFICQVSSYANLSYTAPNTQIGQLAAAEDNPSKIYLVAPKYFFNYNNDNVHLIGVDHRRLGEYYGKVMKKVLVDGESWKPLSPSSVSITANVITVNFHVPVPPLQFDIVKVMDTANYGFKYYDSTNSATITNVALGSNGTSVIITLSNTPTGSNKKIAYAYTSSTPTVNNAGRYNPGSAKGNLRDSDTTPALYTTNLPTNFGTELNNWCVHFIKDIP